jgi:HAD superfamily hydrolase (TIGR01509 family)
MLKAIILDFDGVLADTEPLHYRVFHKVLSEEGLGLKEHDYYEKYIGLDDKGCFQAVLSDQGCLSTSEIIRRLVDRKAGLFLQHLKTELVIYPGIVQFIDRAAASYRLAIVSGALRHEIEYVLEAAGIRKQFEHITTAQDIGKGKPDPEGYLHSLRNLSQKTFLAAAECLVIEDSPPGIQAAHAAGMRCLAVSNTYPSHQLLMADAVTSTLQGYDLSSLERRFWTG